jgi:hypothetical protein
MKKQHKFKEQYESEISSRFAALDNLYSVNFGKKSQYQNSSLPYYQLKQQKL